MTKETIEVPFGAKDSEFIKDEYFIPEGCKARIEGSKVIIEKIQKEEELTEFEKAVRNILVRYISDIDDFPETIKSEAKTLLDLARKELEKEITKEVEQKAINHTHAYQNGYENGKYDALKSLPKWKKAKNDEELDCHVAIQQDDRVVLSDFVEKDEYYITLDVLKTLPKEE